MNSNDIEMENTLNDVSSGSVGSVEEYIEYDISIPKLVMDLVSFGNRSALQEALHKMKKDEISSLSNNVIKLKPLYDDELNKLKYSNLNESNNNNKKKNDFFEIIIEINKTINWSEAMSSAGILYEKLDIITLDFKEFLQLYSRLKTNSFNTINKEEFNRYITSIQMFETNFSALGLLSFYVRGMFYYVTKTNLKITTEEFSNRFNLNIHGVYRMIKLYILLKKYPLLLKCNIPATKLINHAKQIDNYIINDENIYSKCINKIKNIKITSNDEDMFFELNIWITKQIIVERNKWFLIIFLIVNCVLFINPI